MAYKQISPQVVAEGGTGASTLTGVLTGNGTSAVTANAVTQYGVLVGGASNAVDSTAVGTATHVLTSNGAGLAPTFQAPATAGDVTGPVSSTDNALARWDGTSGDTLQDSTVIVSDAGEMINASQPAFLAYLGTTDVNETGDGTTYILGDTDVGTALTEVFDQNSDFITGSSSGATFTAPVAGRYAFTCSFYVIQLSSSMTSGVQTISTSNRDYLGWTGNPANHRSGNNDATFQATVFADMDAMDTCTTNIVIYNGALAADIASITPLATYFSGYLVC